jgi:hypothetical protein
MADTTTRYGFPFQEATDPPDGAGLGQDLAEAVEASLGDVEDDLTALTTRVTTAESDIDAHEAAWTTYTPVFTTASGSPAVGTGGGGNITGRHKKIGRLCTVSGYMKFGTTGASAGTGEWRMSLPFTAATVTDQAWLGSVYMNDASAGASGHFIGTAVVASGGTYATFYGGNAAAQVTGTTPVAWSPGDAIRWEVTYETAS